jgi:alanine or glycine:cation symporter, AGCS family
MNESGSLIQQLQSIESFIYAPYAIPALLLLVGGWLTLRTGVVQIRRFGTALAFLRKGAMGKDTSGEGSITPFQALSTALAATVGNGNIGGVATAIVTGGPGAVFWMWVCAAVGMCTKYSEAVLGVRYRVTTERGDLAAGPMYYISRGLPSASLGKFLAYLFCIFGAATALLGTGNMAQSNTVVQTFVKAGEIIFHVTISPWVPGIIITAFVGFVLLGGLQRIAAVCERLVPTMIVIYVFSALVYVFLNLSKIPHVFGLIFENAFTPAAAAGGFIGASVSQAIAAGISRGVLSNEAGLGSAPIAHGVARVNHPVEQGVVGIMEVFIDTIVVCSMTAFIILSSGLWTDAAYRTASGDLTSAALNTSIPWGLAPIIVALSSFLFGFSTLIGWCYYGEKCFEFLLGPKGIVPYRVIFTALTLVGALVAVPIVWSIGTILNGFMAFPNLIGLFFLSGTVAKLTKDYFSGQKAKSVAG